MRGSVERNNAWVEENFAFFRSLDSRRTDTQLERMLLRCAPGALRGQDLEEAWRTRPFGTALRCLTRVRVRQSAGLGGRLLPEVVRTFVSDRRRSRGERWLAVLRRHRSELRQLALAEQVMTT